MHSYTCTPPHSAALCLIEHRDNFAVTFLQLMRILCGMVTNSHFEGAWEYQDVCFCTHKMQHHKPNIEYDLFSILVQ
jgi:hypothetical protein